MSPCVADLAEPVRVLSVGAQTAIGRTAPASAAAVRAGVAGVVEHPYMIDKMGEPMMVARASWLSDELDWTGRFLALASGALEEAVEPLIAQLKRAEIAVYLGLPAARPGLPAEIERRLSDRLQERFREAVRLADLRMFHCGHAAGLMALEAGWRQISDGAADWCLIGGLESYLSPETLEWIDASGQLRSPNNSWGFTPGEAAGFCLLASERVVARHGLNAVATVTSVATAYETELIKTGAVCLGEGLSSAFKGALAALHASTFVDDMICDLNGETYRADEFAFTLVRTAQCFRRPGVFLAPADCWGDVGAASGPLFLALAVAGGLRGYSKGPYTLLWTSSEGGERGAALIFVKPGSKTIPV